MIIDTHVHFDVFAEGGSLPDVIARAREAGVERMVAVGGTDPANYIALQVARDFPGTVRAAIGYDRDECLRSPDLTGLAAMLEGPHVCAMGETGLDYHYLPDEKSRQKVLFAQMLELAVEHALPVIIHSREAESDTLELLDRFPGITGVLHCFTGSLDFARELMARNIYISFSGILTFRTADEHAAAAALVPENLLLAETDAPFLAPVPYRGQQNEPAFVVETVRKLASIRNCTVEQMAAITSRNAARLFGWRDVQTGE